MKHRFDTFIAIDWSGARGLRLKNIKAAVCEPGESVPTLVHPPSCKNWRRDEVVHRVVEEARKRRILAGFDFAFAYPYCDHNAYFPGHMSSPESARALWQIIDVICQAEGNFYGGPFYNTQSALFSRYLCYQTYRGLYFDNKRLRTTEMVCRRAGALPTCPFKLVGADQVGAGSVAGMRVLHFLATNYRPLLNIWPFSDLEAGKSTVVEIFPRLYFIMTGNDPRQWNDVRVVNAALKEFDTKPLPRGYVIESEDEADAIVSAAALRSLSTRDEVWCSQSLHDNVRRYEGWIFGIN